MHEDGLDREEPVGDARPVRLIDGPPPDAARRSARDRARVPSGPTAEAETVRQAQDGDRDAFDLLYGRYVARVFALCLRMSGERVAAEQLTQDAFVKAWQRLRTFRGESAFSSWLHRLAVNVVLEDDRRERRRSARVAIVDEPEVFERPTAGPTEIRLDLERAIAALPAGARMVLVLHDIEGYKHAEIGAMLGIAIGTAKAQLHRARRLLREMIEP